jgi:hypothetical protein
MQTARSESRAYQNK